VRWYGGKQKKRKKKKKKKEKKKEKKPTQCMRVVSVPSFGLFTELFDERNRDCCWGGRKAAR
jgi:hypothetical protein